MQHTHADPGPSAATSSPRWCRWLAPLLALSWAGCGSQPPPVDPYRLRFDCAVHKDMTVGDSVRMRPAALDSTLQVLGDDQSHECWIPAIRILGHVGDERAVSSLIALISHYGAKMSTTWEIALVTEAFDSLGRLASKGVSSKRGDEGVADQAMNWLLESTDPVQWTKRPMKWTEGLRQRQLIGQLTKMAVRVLGRTDHRLARSQLRRMALAQAEHEAYQFTYDTSSVTATHPSGLFTLNPLPPGRMALAMEAVGRIDGSCAGVPLRDQARALELDARAAWGRERAWLNARKEQRTFVANVRKADAVADRRLGGFNLQLQSLFSLRDDDADHQALIEIKQALFPEGARTVARAPRDKQWAMILGRLDDLEKRHGAAVARLGLTDALAQVRAAHEDLRDALEIRWKGEPVEAVLAERRRLQLRLHRIVAGTLTCHGGESAADDRTRRQLLEPILAQHSQVSTYLRRQEPVRDLDPDTRQEVTPIEEMGPPPPSVIEEPGDAEPIPGLEPEPSALPAGEADDE